MPGPSVRQRLKERKLAQWGLAYLAGAWVLYEAVATIGGHWSLPDGLFRGLSLLLIFGFFLALILAWYHGEMGRQRVSGPELLMIATLLVIAGGVLTLVGRGEFPRMDSDGQPAAVEEYNLAAILNTLPGIAVLPFANRSQVISDQYFTDGVQDALLTRLQRISGLRVLSRTSSDAYRETTKTIPEIGRELGVEYLLEGGVLRSGDQVRINVQLIDVRSDDHVWAEEYDRVLTPDNLFEIQSEIVRTVAGELHIHIRDEERLKAAWQSTKDLEAYDLFLRGLSRGAAESIRLFEAAIERDPEFVAGHLVLARNLAYGYQMGWGRTEERKEAALRAAERALELAPLSPDAKLVMGLYLYRVEKDYAGALEWFGQIATTLLGDFEYHYYRALTERRMGRWSQAVSSFNAALALSPRVLSGWRELGLTYLFLRRYDQAETSLERAQSLASTPVDHLARLYWLRDGSRESWSDFLHRNPTGYTAWETAMHEGRFQDAAAILEAMAETYSSQHYWYPRTLLEGVTMEAQGLLEPSRERLREAIGILIPLVEESPDDERYHASLAWAYAGLGMGEEAVREARRGAEIMSRERDAMEGPFFLFYLGAIHAQLGEVEEAVAVLKELLSAPARFSAPMLEAHFRLRYIRDDPLFQELLEAERNRAF